MKKRNLFYDQTGFADLIAKIKKTIQTLEWELENAAYLEDEIVKQIQILLGNLQTLLDVCEVESDLSIVLAMRLFGREVELWQREVLPNLRLNKKFLDVGKGKTIELLATAGHQFERTGSGFRSAMPHTIRVAGERYEISDRAWTPIPALDPGDETTLFAARELFKVRIAAKGAKPVSEREKQEAADKAIVAADENKLRLEAELLTGEK